MADHRFDKVCEELNVEKVCIGQIWLLRAAAAQQVNSINRMVFGQLVF